MGVHSDDFDIAIVGAAAVGATLACALADCGWRIAVLERDPPSAPQADIDLRVFAVNPAAARVLSAVGAWRRLPAERLTPFREMRVWDAKGSGSIHFDCADLGEPQLGWIVESNRLQAALWAQMQARANIELFCPARLLNLANSGAGLHACLADGRRLRTRLLVGADGPDSAVRRLAGIPTGGWDYGQRAVVATVSTELRHQDTAWQRFLPSGPLAFLPLFDGRSSIVWSTHTAQADALLALEASEFAGALGQAFAGRLGAVTDVGPRAAFDLRLQYARRYIQPRIALLGDAAHVVHPLAGQGVNLGLLDAAALAETLLEAHARSYDIGAVAVLRRYERWRKSENAPMMAALDGLQRLFGTRIPLVPWLRNTGLNLTDALLPLKNLFARHAMGLSGDLPRLARAGSSTIHSSD